MNDTLINIGIFIAGSGFTFAGSYIAMKTSLTRLEERHKALTDTVADIKRTVYGDTNPGLKVMVDRHEQRLEALEG